MKGIPRDRWRLSDLFTYNGPIARYPIVLSLIIAARETHTFSRGSRRALASPDVSRRADGAAYIAIMKAIHLLIHRALPRGSETLTLGQRSRYSWWALASLGGRRRRRLFCTARIHPRRVSHSSRRRRSRVLSSERASGLIHARGSRHLFRLSGGLVG